MSARRWLLGLGVIVVLAAGVIFVVPLSRWWVIGTWRSEPFQDGYPLSYWIKQLESGTLQSKMQAVESLAKMDKDAIPAVPALARFLCEKNQDLIDTSRGPEHGKKEYERAKESQTLAAQALIKHGPQARAAIPILLTDLRARDDKDRYDVLAAIGPEAIRAVIEQSLLPENRRESGRIVWNLLKIGPPALPSVIEALQDNDHYIRYVAVYTVQQSTEERKELANFGPEVKQAVPNLLKLIHDPVHQQQRPDDKDKKTLVWWMAVDALSRIDPRAKEPLPLYVDWLLDGKPVVDPIGGFAPGQPLRALKASNANAGFLVESWQWVGNPNVIVQPYVQGQLANTLRHGFQISSDPLEQELAAETQARLTFRTFDPGQPKPQPVTTPWKENSWANENRKCLDHEQRTIRYAIATTIISQAGLYRRDPAEQEMLADLRRCVPILADGLQSAKRSVWRWRCAESLRMLVVADEGRQQPVEVWRRELAKELKAIVPGLKAALQGTEAGIRDTVEIVIRHIETEAGK